MPAKRKSLKSKVKLAGDDLFPWPRKKAKAGRKTKAGKAKRGTK